MSSSYIPNEYAQLIRHFLQPTAHKKRVYVNHIPEEAQQKVRESTMKPWGGETQEIVAIIDTTMFGSLINPVVLTHTHCFTKDFDEYNAFEYNDIEYVDGFDGFAQSNLMVKLKGFNISKVPCGNQDELMEKLFHQIATLSPNRKVKSDAIPRNPITQQPAAVPSEVKGWNWGAFILGFFYGIFNGLPFIPFLHLIPGVNLVVAILTGIYGQEWSWKKKNWSSVDHFLRVQKKWNRAGLVVFIIVILWGIVAGIIKTIDQI